MPRKYGLFLFSVVSSLAILALAGCGGSSVLAPLPTGGFTNANLSGMYAFSITGTNTGGFFGIAGSIQADGNGNVTSGTIDINSPGTGLGVQTNVAVSGTYIVHADGRGNAALNTTFGTINVDFVLLSNQHGFIIRFDNNATASGSIDQQTSSAFNLGSLAGNLVLNVGGVDGAGQNPESSVGLITVDSSGNITSGVQDSNDNGTPSNVAVTPTAAGMTITNSTIGRGTVAITAGGATRNFAFYVIGPNQVRMLETDTAPILAGDAFRQNSTAISGSFAFTVSGAAAGSAFAAGGIIDTDGAGNVLNTSVEDVNSGGTINSNVGLSGTYSVAASGRGLLSMNSGTINYAIYPTTNGIQAVRVDNNVVAAGTAFQQSGSFSNSSINGRFGGGLTGVDLVFASEFDAVKQFTADGNGNIKGAMDLNDGGALTTDLNLTGTYTLSANGRSSAVGILKTAARNLSVIYYAVNSSRVLFIEVDNSVAVGAFAQQQ